MIAVVGPDMVAGGEGESWWGDSEELLIVDGRMRTVAVALNALHRPLREVLVLHHVTGLSPEDLARLLETPAAQVAAQIGRGERLLAKHLAGPHGEGDEAATPDVRSVLDQFAAGLDGGWMAEVAACAMDYLAGSVRRYRPRRRASDRN
jgi:hypothetical protein